MAAVVLTEKLVKTQVKRHQDNRLAGQVRNCFEGEIMQSWSTINKTKKPRDVIHRLLKLGDPIADSPAQYEGDSQHKANIARNYRNSIQKQGRDTTPDLRDPTIEVVLQRVTRKITPMQAELLQKN
jgi:hypothetical protein